MDRNLSHLVLIVLLGYATQSLGQTTYNGPTVEMNDLRIELRSVGEDQFAVHLTDKLTGLQEAISSKEKGRMIRNLSCWFKTGIAIRLSSC